MKNVILLLSLALCACGGPEECSAVGGGGGRPATMGNGVREGTEQCDDGNTTSSDGCSATGMVESGYTCAVNPAGLTADSCTAAMPAGAVMIFDSDHMANVNSNVGLVNGDQVRTWQSNGLTGDATNASSGANNYAAGALVSGAETGHDEFYSGNSSVQMSIAGTQTSLAFISTTGVFDCFFSVRMADLSSGLTSTSPLLVDAGFKTFFYLNTSGADNGKMSVILNGGSVFFNTGPAVPLGARSILEWEGDGSTIRMRLNNGTASTVSFAGSASPTSDLVFGADPSVTYFSTGKLMREAYCYNTELSSGNRSIAVAHMQNEMDSAARSVIEAQGDSITALGVNGTSKSWPQDLEVSLAAAHPRTYLVGNGGVAGDRVSNVDSRMTTSVLGKANVSAVVFLVGGNDIIQTSNSAATVYGDTSTVGTYKYMLHRCRTDTPTKACYCASLIPFGGYSGWTQDRQDRYDAFNTLLHNDAECSGFIDLWRVLRATTTGACAGNAYDSHTGACVMSTTTGCGGSSCDGTGESGLSPDGLHPGMAGEAAIAAAVQSAMGL